MIEEIRTKSGLLFEKARTQVGARYFPERHARRMKSVTASSRDFDPFTANEVELDAERVKLSTSTDLVVIDPPPPHPRAGQREYE